jgi:hypothetical protein
MAELRSTRDPRTPEFRVKVRERFVHQEDLRFAHDRPPHGNTLALSTGQRTRVALEIVLEVEHLGGLADATIALGLGDLADLESKAHVVGDGHLRIESVVLEHHCDVALLWSEVGHVDIADVDASLVDVLETRKHPQTGRLAAAGRSDEHQELAVVDVEVEPVDTAGVFEPG